MRHTLPALTSMAFVKSVISSSSSSRRSRRSHTCKRKCVHVYVCVCVRVCVCVCVQARVCAHWAREHTSHTFTRLGSCSHRLHKSHSSTKFIAVSSSAGTCTHTAHVGRTLSNKCWSHPLGHSSSSPSSLSSSSSSSSAPSLSSCAYGDGIKSINQSIV